MKPTSNKGSNFTSLRISVHHCTLLSTATLRPFCLPGTSAKAKICSNRLPNTHAVIQDARPALQSVLSLEQIKVLGELTLPNDSLEIPYRQPDGSPEQCQDGKPFRRWHLPDGEIAAATGKGRYRSPKGNGCRIYHSALAIKAGRYQERLQDRFTPLWLTKGELKTEAANAHDPEHLTIGLGGVSSWRDRYDGVEESQPLMDFDEIELEGRGKEVQA